MKYSVGSPRNKGRRCSRLLTLRCVEVTAKIWGLVFSLEIFERKEWLAGGVKEPLPLLR